MAFTLRGVRVPPNSVSLEEARKCTFEFFRSACRSLPTIMEIYNLHDVVYVSPLRSTIASKIHKNSHITNTKVPKILNTDLGIPTYKFIDVPLNMCILSREHHRVRVKKHFY
ncbi:hypothetical protein RJ641_005132 [Dillenia turbinata]|uniref:Uncharacterized protein n=1 Tax=Dillenia turbinata TaxID=194707 RepID=A0AAN8VGF2_9MAGN